MRITVNIDDTLLAKVQGLSGPQERNALIQRESAKRLAKLAGSEPDLQDIPRR